MFSSRRWRCFLCSKTKSGCCAGARATCPNPATKHVFEAADADFGKYMRGKVIEAVLVFAAAWIAFLAFGLNFAFALALMTGASVFIPFVGAAVVTFPVVLTALLQFGFSSDFALVVAAYAIIQIIDAQILVPILFSEVVRLHPIAIFTAIIFFGNLWGVWGVFFAIPLASFLKSVLLLIDQEVRVAREAAPRIPTRPPQIPLRRRPPVFDKIGFAPMSIMRRALFLSSPETAHAMALRALRARAALGAIALPQDPRRVMGLDFPNPVGLAAGFDKNGDSIAACGLLGFGFVEVGTITPRPQNGNPRPRVFRIPAREAVVNRMGLNNCGAQQAARNIAASRARYPGVVGASVGHNDDTPPDQIAADFVAALRAVFPVADYIALNVSCPNIRNFDAAREPRALREIITAAVAERDSLAAQTGKKTPLAVKVSPDLDDNELSAFAEIAADGGIAAVIAANTTLRRDDDIRQFAAAREKGGLSGKPLAAQAIAITRKLRALLPPSIAIIGAGGVMTANDARQRIEAGADLVQIYTGLIYRGPSFPRQICRALVARRQAA